MREIAPAFKILRASFRHVHRRRVSTTLESNSASIRTARTGQWARQALDEQ
jgi:hypothetical protein